MAVGEALSNAFIHAYDRGTGPLEIDLMDEAEVLRPGPRGLGTAIRMVKRLR